MLTLAEEKALSVRIQAGDEKAVEELVLANLRLAVFYAGKFRFGTDPLSAALIGLLEAARRFDWSKGKFSVYARWYIFRRITADAFTDRQVAMPESYSYLSPKLSHYLFEHSGEPLDADKIAKAIGTRKHVVDGLMQFGVSLDELMAESNFEPAHIEHDGRDESGSTAMLDIILSELNRLPPRKRSRVKKYYGLGCEAKNQPDIAAEEKVTKQAVSVDIRKALVVLRKRLKSNHPNEFGKIKVSA